MMIFSVGEGSSEKKYIVSKKDARKSPIINVVLEGRDSESWITYHFEDTSDGAVNFLVQWLHLEKLDVIQLAGEDICDDVVQEDHELIDLWLLAAKLKVPQLQNDTLKTIDVISRTVRPGDTDNVPTHCLRRLYEDQTAEIMKLRSYMVALCAEELDFEKDDDDDEVDFPEEFMRDLATFWAKKRQPGLCKVADFYVTAG